MPLSTTPGTPYTWATAGWSWSDARASKTWATAYPAIYLETDVEAFSAAEARGSDVDVFDAEGLGVADIGARDALVLEAESLAATDALSPLAAFLRDTAEALTADEVSALDIDKIFSEAATLAELRSVVLAVQETEALSVDDANSAFFTALLAEALGIDEVTATLVDFLRLSGESLSLVEARLSDATLSLAESLEASDTLSPLAVWARNTAEALSASDANAATVLATFGELIAPTDVNESVVEFSRDTAEPLLVAEDYIDLIGFILSSIESIFVAEQRETDIEVLDAEGFEMTEAQTKQVESSFEELLNAAENYIDLIGFLNVIAESIAVSEARGATTTKRSAEAVALLERMIRRANAVIADLAIRSSGMTQAQFAERIASRRPLGNFPPKPLQPGDYRYERAIIGILLQDVARTTRNVAVDMAKLTVDVPDVTDRGSVTLTSSGYTVSFARSFYDAPEIQVIQTAGSTRAIPSVTTITSSGFFVQLFDAASPTTPVAGTISWTALGK